MPATPAPLNVSYGSMVMLKQRYSEPCWLQSTAGGNYPLHPRGAQAGLVSSRQQMVACASRSRRNDTEAWWVVVSAQNPEAEHSSPPTPVRHGDAVALRHHATGKLLNSHDVAAPISPHLQEVSCYGVGDEVAPAGQPGHMPRYDSWELTLLIQDYHQLQAGVSVFTLTHVKTGAALQCSGHDLPRWGGHHREIVAGFDKTDVSGGWTIDAHVNHRLPARAPPAPAPADAATAGDDRRANTPASDLQGQDHLEGPKAGGNERAARTRGATAPASESSSPASAAGHNVTFWERFVELHETMIAQNSALTGAHLYASKASEWPWLHRGVLYWKRASTTAARGTAQREGHQELQPAVNSNGAASTTTQIYLLGNPVGEEFARATLHPDPAFAALCPVLHVGLRRCRASLWHARRNATSPTSQARSPHTRETV